MDHIFPLLQRPSCRMTGFPESLLLLDGDGKCKEVPIIVHPKGKPPEQRVKKVYNLKNESIRTLLLEHFQRYFKKDERAPQATKRLVKALRQGVLFDLANALSMTQQGAKWHWCMTVKEGARAALKKALNKNKSRTSRKSGKRIETFKDLRCLTDPNYDPEDADATDVETTDADGSDDAEATWVDKQVRKLERLMVPVEDINKDNDDIQALANKMVA